MFKAPVKPKKIILTTAALCLFFVISKFCIPQKIDTKIPQQAVVRFVVDGDTLILNNNQKVRLIGVDTPEVYESDKLFRDAERQKIDVKEIIKQGRKSSAFTKDLAAGRKIRLEFDESNERIKHKDKYGRLLAYIFILDTKGIKRSGLIKVEKDGQETIFLNASLVNAGYATVFRRFEFRYKDYFLRLEKSR